MAELVDVFGLEPKVLNGREGSSPSGAIPTKSRLIRPPAIPILTRMVRVSVKKGKEN